jgi:hypothetical protein
MDDPSLKPDTTFALPPPLVFPEWNDPTVQKVIDQHNEDFARRAAAVASPSLANATGGFGTAPNSFLSFPDDQAVAPTKTKTPNFPFKCTGGGTSVHVNGGTVGGVTLAPATITIAGTGTEYIVVRVPCVLNISHNYVYSFTQNSHTDSPPCKIDVDASSTNVGSTTGGDFQIAVAKYVNGVLETQYNTTSIAINVIDNSSMGVAQAVMPFAF